MTFRSVLLSHFENACEKLLNHTGASTGESFFHVAAEFDERTHRPSARVFQQDGDEDIVYDYVVRVYDTLVSRPPSNPVSQKAKLMVALSQVANCLVLKGTKQFGNAAFCLEVIKLALAAAQECSSLGMWADSQTSVSIAFTLLDFLQDSGCSLLYEERRIVKRLCESMYSLQIVVSYHTKQHEHVSTILRTMDESYSASTWKIAYATCYNIGSRYVKEKSFVEAVSWLNLCLELEDLSGKQMTRDIRNKAVTTLSSALLKLDPMTHWPRVFQLLEDSEPTAESLSLKLYALLFAKQKDETLVSCLVSYLDSLVNRTACVDTFRQEFLKLFSLLLQHKRYTAALAALDQRSWLREHGGSSSSQSEPLRRSVRWICGSVAIKCCLNLDQERDVYNILQEMIRWERASETDTPVIVEAISAAEDLLAPWMDRGYFEQSLDWYKTLIQLSLKQGLTMELGTMVRNAVICAVRSTRPDRFSLSHQWLDIVDSQGDIDLLCLRLQLAILSEDQTAVIGPIKELGCEFQQGMDQKVAVVDGLCKCVKTAVDLRKAEAAVKLLHDAAARAGVCTDMKLEIVRIELRLEYEMFLQDCTTATTENSGLRILDQMLASFDLAIELLGSQTVPHPDEELAELFYDRVLGCAALAWNVASSAGLSSKTRHAFYLRAYRLFSKAGYGRMAVEKTSHCAVLVILTGLQAAAAAEAKDACSDLYAACLRILDEFDRYKVLFQMRRSEKTLTISEGVIRLLLLCQILLLVQMGDFATVRSLITSCRRQMQAGLIRPETETLENLSLILDKMDILPDHQHLSLHFLEEALSTCVSSESPNYDKIHRILYRIITKSLSLSSARTFDNRRSLAILERVLKNFVSSRTPEMFHNEISWIAGILSILGMPSKNCDQIEGHSWVNVLQEFNATFPDSTFLSKLLAAVSFK